MFAPRRPATVNAASARPPKGRRSVTRTRPGRVSGNRSDIVPPGRSATGLGRRAPLSTGGAAAWYDAAYSGFDVLLGFQFQATTRSPAAFDAIRVTCWR